MQVSIDFETYSDSNIRELGAWGYSKHPTTEVICMAYAYGDETPELWLPGKPLPRFVTHPDEFTFRAWNSFFECCIWHNVLDWPRVPIQQWTDTAALAAALAMPRALANCGAALDVAQDKQKDKRGKYLIQRLCKPFRGKRVQDQELLEELYDYCRQDVVAEREIEKQLRPLSPTERKVWELDQLINIRGVHVDTQAINNALTLIDQVTAQLNSEVDRITSGVLANVSQRQRVMDYIEALGYPLEKFDKAYLEKILEDASLPPVARRLIEIRRQLGKTSTAKYLSIHNRTDDDNRVRGNLMYHGASTGRWASTGINVQNLPRPSFDDTDTCIELFEYQDPELIQIIYDDPMGALSSCLRGMICAPEGKRLIVCDYSAIEARVLAWLAGQPDVLEVFRGHGKIYEHTASQIYKKPIDSITKNERFIGKVATLALGYQGGAKAFQGMAETYGVAIDSDLAETVKTDWRNANDKIVRFWWDCESAAIKAVKQRGNTFKVRSVAFRTVGRYLFCKLPSGRVLAYCQPQITIGKFDKEQVTFMGTNSVTRKWERQQTYGGKLVENITQAVARDLMAEAMLRVEAKGYEVVLSVHDELIAEAKSGFGSVEEFKKLMCELPQWAEGLPVSAEGFECGRYRK